MPVLWICLRQTRSENESVAKAENHSFSNNSLVVLVVVFSRSQHRRTFSNAIICRAEDEANFFLSSFDTSNTNNNVAIRTFSVLSFFLL